MRFTSGFLLFVGLVLILQMLFVLWKLTVPIDQLPQPINPILTAVSLSIASLSANKLTKEKKEHKKVVDVELLTMIETISGKHLFAPPLDSANLYTLHNNKGTTPTNEEKAVLSALGDKGGGFFVEVGSKDGETFSRTVYLERTRDWQGILIEASESRADEIVSKGRAHAWVANGCLATPSSTDTTPTTTENEDGVSDTLQPTDRCFPLHAFVASVCEDIKVVDLLALGEVGDGVVELLQGVKWGKLQVRAILVSNNRRDQVKGFLSGQSYRLETNLDAHDLYLWNGEPRRAKPFD